MQAEETPPAGHMMLIHYLCAAGAVLALAMNVRPILAAFTAMADLVSR